MPRTLTAGPPYDPALAPVEAVIKAVPGRFAAAAPRPWRSCGQDRGGCSCGSIWSVPADGPIATVIIGEWGDQIAVIEDDEPHVRLSAYGSVGDACGKANATLIVTAVNAYDQQHAILREFIAIEEEWQTVPALDSAADLMDRRRAAVAAARLLVAEGE